MLAHFTYEAIFTSQPPYSHYWTATP